MPPAGPPVVAPGPLTVFMEIEGPAADILTATELIYEFKYDHELDALTDFQEQYISLEFSVATALFREVANFISRLKANGLRVHSSWIAE